MKVHIVLMKESPFGGNGPGRLDYYLWPYLERDLAAGRCTLEEAKEIIDELFLRIGALLRRAKIAASRKLEIGSFVMDADEHTAYLNEEEISMTNREFSIL